VKIISFNFVDPKTLPPAPPKRTSSYLFSQQVLAEVRKSNGQATIVVADTAIKSYLCTSLAKRLQPFIKGATVSVRKSNENDKALIVELLKGEPQPPTKTAKK
jgi:hypothetical protein